MFYINLQNIEIRNHIASPTKLHIPFRQKHPHSDSHQLSENSLKAQSSIMSIHDSKALISTQTIKSRHYFDHFSQNHSLVYQNETKHQIPCIPWIACFDDQKLRFSNEETYRRLLREYTNHCFSKSANCRLTHSKFSSNTCFYQGT